ncbi:hypothetical protein [Sphingobium nicotianae]|nr:hypothetical protein [Sphingobium nicotianae]
MPEAYPARTRRLSAVIIAFPIVLIGGGVALKALHLGWIGLVGYLVLAMIMTVALVRAAQARAKATGCASPAMIRYNNRMMVASMLYMAILFLSIFAFKHWHLAGPLLWAAAIATAAPVLGMVWAMARLVIEESDEYLRSRIVRQALFGLGGLLAIGTVWGFLEQFELVPHVPAWAVVPVFALGLGVSNLIFRGDKA